MTMISKKCIIYLLLKNFGSVYNTATSNATRTYLEYSLGMKGPGKKYPKAKQERTIQLKINNLKTLVFFSIQTSAKEI